MTLRGTRQLYHGRVIDFHLDEVEFPDGSTGTLEMVRHPGAAAVLPFLDPPTGHDPRVLLIRQFRHGAGGPLWEVPAGRLDAGEAPESCAHRELAEETGYRATTLMPLGPIHTTPGFSDEVIHLFAASGLVAGSTAHEADEFIELHTLRWREVMAMAGSGEISDGKTPAVWIASNTIPECKMVECVRRAFEGITYPPPVGGSVVVVYPLAFEPG